MRIKKGDTVVVITGKDKGKTGNVLSVSTADNKVVVAGINIVTKHKKPRSQEDKGGIVKMEAGIDASNVQVICPVCGKATRVAHAEVDGKKVRVCKKCNASLEAKAEVKKAPAKRASKKADKEEVAAEKPAKKTSKKKSNVEEA